MKFTNIKTLGFTLLVSSMLTLSGCDNNNTTTIAAPSAEPTAQELAIDKIEAFAESGGTGTVPTLQDYLDAGVTGVTADNLAEINEVVENLTPEEVDTPEEIQALKDALGVDISVDIIPPVVTLTGDANIMLAVSSSYTEEGATAVDDVDGDLGVVITGTVDTSTTGTYILTYTATDSSGNNASVSRTVNIVDELPPVVTLTGDAAISLNVGDTYDEEGATAVDETDGTLSVVITGTVDTSTAETYTLTYTATDSSDNEASVTRTVTVEAVASSLSVINFCDVGNNEEIWTSDGTESGTVVVKEIATGTASSYPSYITHMNGTDFFSANDNVNGTKLWKSDGTAEGTVMVKDIVAGTNGSNPRYLTNMNGTLFFSAYNGVSGTELWKSDGTAAGTVSVGASVSNVNYITNVNGTLFFQANNQLWKSDGTAAGTVLVSNIANVVYLTAVNDTLFFQANNQLWKSDGTAEGTVMVKDIVSYNMVNFNGTLFFSGYAGVNGYELWKSDGTAEGTVMVKDIVAGTNGSSPEGLTSFNGKLFFLARDDSGEGSQVWISDGTDAGTIRISNAYTSTGGLVKPYLQDRTIFQVIDGKLYINVIETNNYYRELWTTDGTEAGTGVVKTSTCMGFF